MRDRSRCEHSLPSDRRRVDTCPQVKMTLRKVKGNFERLFDKNLTDLVRGIRNNRDNEAKYISQCIEEIKAELRLDNMSVKANAIAKLTYVSMDDVNDLYIFAY